MERTLGAKFGREEMFNVQWRYLIPALYAWAARAKKDMSARSNGTQLPEHGCMGDLTTEHTCSFDS